MRRGSLELGIQTLVLIGIAIVTMALGIAWVAGVFSKANDVTEGIDTRVETRTPTAAEPLILSPREISVKSGETQEADVLIYNIESTNREYSARVGSCTQDARPGLVSLPGMVPAHESVTQRIIVDARDAGVPLDAGTYICKLIAMPVTEDGGDMPDAPALETQFTLRVTI